MTHTGIGCIISARYLPKGLGMSGSILLLAIAGVVLGLTIMVTTTIRIKRINRNYALYKTMMDEKAKNTSLFWEFLRKNYHLYSDNLILISQNHELKGFIEKDEDLIYRICALGKIYEGVRDLRLEDSLKQVILNLDGISESIYGSSETITH